MRKNVIARFVTISAGIAVVAATGAAALAASSGAAPVTYYGCVKTSGTPNRQLFDVHSNKVITCPAGSFAIHWGQAGPQGPRGPQGPAGPSDLSVTASTSVSNRDDSGGQGNWASDSFIRVITITRHEEVSVSQCGGGVPSCWYYTGTITDSGTFLTPTGAQTPNASCTEPSPSNASCAGLQISGQVAGDLTGGSHIEFYASSSAPDASLVPSTVSGGSPSTGDWYQQFFPGSVSFSGAANLIDWSWTYTAPSTCEKWTDAYNNGDGSGSYAADGNIAGINQCPA